MQVIGAGLGRTGTTSLKLALETLLGEPCYHMYEAMNRPGDAAGWQLVADGHDPGWDRLLAGWGATVDWPTAAFYAEQADAFPDAKVLLSYRDSEAWWTSADKTIFVMSRRPAAAEQVGLGALMTQVFAEAGIDVHDKAASIRAFEEHNQRVRETIAPERLIEWQPGDGWGPICEGLGLPIPTEDFPHSNNAGSFRDVARDALAGNVLRNVADAPPQTYSAPEPS